jgi:hypothetical protein
MRFWLPARRCDSVWLRPRARPGLMKVPLAGYGDSHSSARSTLRGSCSPQSTACETARHWVLDWATRPRHSPVVRSRARALSPWRSQRPRACSARPSPPAVTRWRDPARMQVMELRASQCWAARCRLPAHWQEPARCRPPVHCSSQAHRRLLARGSWPPHFRQRCSPPMCRQAPAGLLLRVRRLRPAQCRLPAHCSQPMYSRRPARCSPRPHCRLLVCSSPTYCRPARGSPSAHCQLPVRRYPLAHCPLSACR